MGSVDLEAQSRKKKKKRGTKQRTTQTDESSDKSGDTKRIGDVRGRDDKEQSKLMNFLSSDRIAFDIMGGFGIQQIGLNNGEVGTVIRIGLKPAISYKALEWLHFGIAPKFNYFFINIPRDDDINWFDVGVEVFTRVKIFDLIFLQLGYDFNSLEAYYNEREWTNGAMIGGGYMNGFGQWKYGLQVLFELNEDLRDYDNFPLEIWAGFTYNL